MMRALCAMAALICAPSLAFAGQITLFNTSDTAIELRAVRKGTVTIPAGEAKSFFYQAEDGDFRVWSAAAKCELVFGFEASEDAKLQFDKDTLFRVPADTAKALAPAELGAQPAGWPMKVLDKICD